MTTFISEQCFWRHCPGFPVTWALHSVFLLPYFPIYSLKVSPWFSLHSLLTEQILSLLPTWLTHLSDLELKSAFTWLLRCYIRNLKWGMIKTIWPFAPQFWLLFPYASNFWHDTSNFPAAYTENSKIIHSPAHFPLTLNWLTLTNSFLKWSHHYLMPTLLLSLGSHMLHSTFLLKFSSPTGLAWGHGIEG